MNRSRKNVIIGIDGVPHGLIEDLTSRNIMPNFKDLLGEGRLSMMESSIPEISSVSWASIMTGKNPGEHGIYGFTDLIPGSYNMMFPSFRNLRSDPFWRLYPKKKHVVINLPFTYPAGEINGSLISGFVAPDLERSVFPPSLYQELSEMDYQIDVDSNKAYKSKELFIKHLRLTHEKRMETYRVLWDRFGWDNFMLVFTGSDRLEHFFWDSYEDTGDPFHQDFLDYFTMVDEAIGEVSERMGEDDNLLVCSDHGMEQIRTNVNLNTLLAEEGYLKTGEHPEKRYKNMVDGTKAFVMEPSRIYLNKKDLYPKGEVKNEEMERLRSELTDLLLGLRYKGDKVIKKVLLREEIYHGPQFEKAPDIVLLPNHGFGLRGSMREGDLFEKDDILIGMHTQEDAFLYTMGPEIAEDMPDHPNVVDIVPLLERSS
ncbi:MAG: alkaline phosphatase family protein [Thermoplasmatota archaeon]